MSEDMPHSERRLTIIGWVLITIATISTVFIHMVHPGPTRSDLMSLGLTLEGISLLIRHRRPKLADILLVAGTAGVVMYVIILFLRGP